jgi:hypothetical protein
MEREGQGPPLYCDAMRSEACLAFSLDTRSRSSSRNFSSLNNNSACFLRKRNYVKHERIQQSEKKPTLFERPSQFLVPQRDIAERNESDADGITQTSYPNLKDKHIQN